MVLLVRSPEPSLVTEPRPSVLVKEIDVHRANIVMISDLLSSPSERSFAFKIKRQQTTARRWSKRDSTQKLRIIPIARSLKRIGPAVVKDIFALGVTLKIERHNTLQCALSVFHLKMIGHPASIRAN